MMHLCFVKLLKCKTKVFDKNFIYGIGKKIDIYVVEMCLNIGFVGTIKKGLN